MSAWTHTICRPCWDKLNPDREPVRVKNAQTEPCCYCGNETFSGIYVRKDPDELPLCKGHPS